MLEQLALLSHTDIAKRGPSDARAWEEIAESSRLMYADRDFYIGKVASAEFYFGKIPQRWPNSPWAVKAKSELTKLAKLPRKPSKPSKIIIPPGGLNGGMGMGGPGGMGMGGMGMGGMGMGGMGMGGMGGGMM